MKKTNHYTITTLLLAMTVFNTWANDKLPGSEIIGRYRLPNHLEIEIYQVEKGYEGKIVALNNFEDGQVKDANNRDKKERETPLLGKVIIENLTYDATSKQWNGGTIYAPEKGMTVNLKIKSINDSVAVAEASKFLFKKTLNWTKIY